MELVCAFISFIGIVDGIISSSERGPNSCDAMDSTVDEMCRICTKEFQDECDPWIESKQLNGTSKSNENASCTELLNKSIYGKELAYETCFKGGDKFKYNQNKIKFPTMLSILPPKTSHCYFNITYNNNSDSGQQFEDRMYVAKRTEGEICSEKDEWSIKHSCLLGREYEKEHFENCLKYRTNSLVYDLSPKYGRINCQHLSRYLRHVVRI